MTEKFRSGERILITIEATVLHHADDEIEYQYPTDLGVAEGLLALDSPATAVKRLAPAGWPPRPGDLWRDRSVNLWFAFRGPAAGEVFMISGNPARRPLSTPMPEEVLHKVGPLVLVHREDERDGAGS